MEEETDEEGHTQLIFKSMFIAIVIASMSCYQMEIASLS